MSILLPTSIGEAIDKLNILDIKCRKIKDEKRLKYVKEEYNELYKLLKDYVNDNKFYYKILNKVNEKLWEIQDDLRLNVIPSTNEATKIVLDENDRRCRIKNKINSKIKSSLREQKGYPLKKALVCSHLGLGDMICMIGIVRYLSTIYDEVYIICKEKYVFNVKLFYEDDETIKIIICNNDEILTFKHGEMYNDMQVFVCGYHATNITNHNYVNNIPEIFYHQMGFNIDTARGYFYLNSTKFENDETIKEILTKDYYFVHDIASNFDAKLSEKLLPENVLIINPNKNPYSNEHPYYKLCEKIQNKPLVFFIPIIENAKKIYCVDSSFFNLANFLETKAKEIYTISRDNRIYPSFTKIVYL